MDKTSFKSRGIPAFGISMVFGGLALLLSVAILGLGTQSASANGVQGPVAQGTQPIPQLSPTVTVVATNTIGATREPTGTAEGTTTAVSTGTVVGTVVATGTAAVTGTAEATGTVSGTGTAVATGTAVGSTATVGTVNTATAVATSTTAAFPTTEVLATPVTGVLETATPVSVGMPRTGTPGGSDLTVILLIVGAMMTTIGFASLAARRSGYTR